MAKNSQNQNTEKNREEILEAALDFFYKYGVREANETELFKGIGVTPNEFYSMFKSKDEVLNEAVEYNQTRQEKIYASLRNKAKNAVEEIMSVLKHGADVMKKVNPIFVTDIMNYYPQIMERGAEYSQDYTLNLYSDIINRGIKEKLFRSDINIQIVTRVILQNGYVFLNYRTFPPDKYSPGEVLRSIYLYYFRGLCQPEGARLIDEYFSEHNF